MQNLDEIWQEIGPWLDERESIRKDAARRFLLGFAISLVVILLIAAVMISSALMPIELVGFLSLGALGLSSWILFAPLKKLKSDVKLTLNHRLASFFGLSYSETMAFPVRFDAFRDHGLIPHSDREAFEDHFKGLAHGADFELYEAHLKQRRRSKNRTYYVTVFRGVLIRISFPRTIEGVTLVTRDKGWFNALENWSNKTFGQAGHKLERIGLVDPDFEKQFEVYGTDQVMARYLLTPSFMERLLDLESLLKGKNVRCVFDENLSEGTGKGELLIAAETGNKFEAGSMFAPINYRGAFETMHSEIELIDHIIQTVLEPARERDF